MPAERKPMRYGHSEGHTDVCFDDTGKFIVTGGSDGDVRIWESLDDDDPKYVNVGERVYSMALKKEKLVTAVSNNTVQLHTFPDGDPDGILTRFTTNATHVTFNGTGSRVAAGSSDFLVKVVDVADISQQKTLRGHEAPVLSVALDPFDEFLASSSCDGLVVVWDIEEQVKVSSWNILPKCNDVLSATSLCRLAWQPGLGKLLAVPVGTAVNLYERGSWRLVGSLADDSTTQPVNVVAWSPCGKYVAAAAVAGLLTVWDVESLQCTERVKHEKGYTVCGMAWHPSGGQIAYTDNEGCLGLLEGLAPSANESNATAAKSSQGKANKSAKDYDDLFDDDEDGHFVEDLGEPQHATKDTVNGDEDEDDDLMPSTGRPRKRGAFLEDDENSVDTGSLKLGLDKYGYEDGAEAGQRPNEGPLPTPPQGPFQPGSTPVHLMHRFMVWNSVGIVRSYNDEQDNAIDVEFHDTSIHHAMHLTNTLSHSMADLSREAVLLACEGTEELASKLQCLHFSSWDTNKEWMVDLPKDEDVKALCLGRGWAAVATSALLVRIFSVGGIQKEIFSLPGPVVCLAGHGEQLLIAYHRGTGFDGEQALGVQLMEFGQKKRVICGDPLPLSRRSTLSWMGFSAEGTPCYSDSEGVLRMLNRSVGNTWTPVCHMRENCKSKSDHYWVVGVHENPQQLRCIPCKGSRFPPTLPRPALAVLPFKLPLCQTTTEKGQMEEQYWRSVLFHRHFDFLSRGGCEVDEEAKARAEKEQQELLMKMFALSCKLDRDFRCVELAQLMTQSVVTLAIRYASRSHRMVLAQRLGQLALDKASMQQEEEEEEEEEGFASSRPKPWRSGRGSQRARREEGPGADEGSDQDDEQTQGEGEAERELPRLTSLNKAAVPAGKPSPKLTTVSKDGRVNPFKVSSCKPAGISGAQPRAGSVLDSMSTSGRKAPAAGSSGVKSIKEPILKPLPLRAKSKTQATLLQMGSTKASKKKQDVKEMTAAELKQTDAAPPPSRSPDPQNQRPRTGFQMWLDEHRESILADNPSLDEVNVVKEAMISFRALSAEDRLLWIEKRKSDSESEVKKRKRAEDEQDDCERTKRREESGAKKKKCGDGGASKLSAFAFHKD